MKYTVLASCSVYYSADIEAGSFEDAIRIAENMDSEDFAEDTLVGDLRIDYITCEDTEETIFLS